MEITNIPKVTYNDQLILTTKQLADFYGCTTTRIKKNFNANKNRFIEGKHYFKLEGEALKQFKNVVTESYSVDSNEVTESYLVNSNVVTEIPPVHNNSSKEITPVHNNSLNEIYSVVGKNANVVFVWTKQGAAHHAKMLHTDKAWKVYEMLEDAYFEAQEKFNSVTNGTTNRTANGTTNEDTAGAKVQTPVEVTVNAMQKTDELRVIISPVPKKFSMEF